MNVKDFLANFTGNNEIQIYDRFDFKTSTFRTANEAIYRFGYYKIRNWNVDNGVINIIIRSQF